jgi:hypothetical protein
MDHARFSGDDQVAINPIHRDRFNNVIFALSMVAVMLGGIIAAGR